MNEHLLAPSKEQNVYIFDGLDAHDAAHLPGLFRKIYGDHYLSADVYNPDHYIDTNRRGEIVSLVARGQDGIPVGHLAMMYSAPYRGVREIGQAVVDPACRGGGILNGLIDRSVMLADNDPHCCGLYGASLSNHTYSQRSVWRAEFVDVGFEIGFVPARMMQIEAQATGPVATALQYRSFGDTPEQQTFLPAAYRDLLIHLFDHIGLSRTFANNGIALDQSGPSQVEVIDLPRFDLVRVNVFRIGADLPLLIARIEREARLAKRTMVQVFLELSSAASDAACDHLRRKGFWFGGLLPRWMDSDALLLQKALGEPCFDGIQAYTNDAKALLRFIRADADRQIALAELGVAAMA
jgi:hypothetical protein